MKLISDSVGNQEPASIHNRAAARFGERLTQRSGAPGRLRVSIGSIPEDSAGPPATWCRCRAPEELSFFYMSRSVSRRGADFVARAAVSWCRIAASRSMRSRRIRRARGRTRVAEQTPPRSSATGTTASGTSRTACDLFRAEDCRGIRIRTQMSDLHGEVFFPRARLRAPPSPRTVKGS